MKGFLQRLLEKSQRRPERRVLVFPRGTIVKYQGIPCELLHDTPYESATIRAMSSDEGDRVAAAPDPED